MASLARSITSSLRKRHRESAARMSATSFGNPEEYEADRNTDEASPSKRRRELNWPLRDDSLAPEQRASPRQVTGTAKRSKRHVFGSARRSKFKEASMHDRPSEQPPSIFMRASEDLTRTAELSDLDELMEDYMSETSAAATIRATSKVPETPNMGGLTLHPNQSISSAAPTTGTGKGSVFRFGRSLASTFNPVNIWHNVVTTFKDSKDDLSKEAVDEQQKLLRERGANAVRAYADLKEAGTITRKSVKPMHAREVFGKENAPTDIELMMPHDSAIQIRDQRSSVERKRDGMILLDTLDDPRSMFPSSIGALATPFPLPKERIQSPMVTDTPLPTKRQSFLFNKSSLGNLKKNKPDGLLVPSNRNSYASFTTDAENFDDEALGCVTGLHRANSRKDLRKQDKLTKRVSDLELQLKVARRELGRHSLDLPAPPPFPRALSPTPLPRAVSPAPRSASPHKKPFVPGALQTLPSESLLPTRATDESNVEARYVALSELVPTLQDASVITFAAASREASVVDIGVNKATAVETIVETVEKVLPPTPPVTERSSAQPPSQPKHIVSQAKTTTPKMPIKRRKNGRPDANKPDIQSEDEPEDRTATRKKKRTSPKHADKHAPTDKSSKHANHKSTNGTTPPKQREEAITQAAIMTALTGSFLGGPAPAAPAARRKSEENARPAASSLAAGATPQDCLPPRPSMDLRLETVLEEAVGSSMTNTTSSSVPMPPQDEPRKLATAAKPPAWPVALPSSKRGGGNEANTRNERDDSRRGEVATQTQMWNSSHKAKKRAVSPPPPPPRPLDAVGGAMAGAPATVLDWMGGADADGVVRVEPGSSGVPRLPAVLVPVVPKVQPQVWVRDGGGKWREGGSGTGTGEVRREGRKSGSGSGEFRAEGRREEWEWPEDVF